MKKMSRLLALALSTVLLISIAACQQLSETDNGTDKTGAKTETKTEDSIYTEIGTYPIVKEPISFEIMLSGNPTVTDYKTNEFTLYFEKYSGINMDFILLTGQDAATTANLKLASDNLPDICIGFADEWKHGVEDNILLNLKDYLKYMPNLSGEFAEYPALVGAATALDGNIYMTPLYNSGLHVQHPNKMWVNTAILNELGEKKPETTEDLERICEAFKKEYPKGFALVGNPTAYNTPVCYLMNAYLFLTSSYEALVTKEDKTVEFQANKPEFKEGIRWLSTLYKKGYLYEGSLSQSLDQARQLFVGKDSPVLFAFTHTMTSFLDSTAQNDLYRVYEGVAPLEGPNGYKYAYYDKYVTVKKGSSCVTKECKYPEAAVRWIDYFYSEEGFYNSQMGPEGKGWERAKPGDKSFTGDDARVTRLIPYTIDLQNHCWSVFINHQPMDFRQITYDASIDIFSGNGLSALLQQTTEKYYVPYRNPSYNTIPSVLRYTQEELDERSMIQVELANYINQTMVEFITGAKSLDTDWDAYVAALDKIGLKKYIDITQKAFDRFNATK